MCFFYANKIQQFTYRKFHVRDDDDEDLASIFSQCHEFIEEGRKNSGGVLVHWWAFFYFCFIFLFVCLFGCLFLALVRIEAEKSKMNLFKGADDSMSK